ncbi:MAG: hypothetical protein JWL81_3020, partial [Verrucomicrobiales bacterium]|nr:hypothetical protein [Verrucomicrobiales bacterium]
IVQDHRWDTAQPSLTSGDTQPAGLVIASHRSPGAGAELIAMSVPPPWLRWRKEKFPSAPDDDTISGPAADPDGDGLVNLLEYALGGEPAAGAGAHVNVLPTVSRAGDGLLFTLTRKPAQYDLRLAIETAPDPAGPWTTGALAVEGMDFEAERQGITLSEDAPENGIVTVRFIQSGDTGASRVFVRMRVGLAGEF